MTDRSYLFTDAVGHRHFLEDAPDGGLQIRTVGATDPHIERAKAMANHNDGYTPSRDMRRLATIPTIIRELWLKEEGWDAYRPDLYPEQLMRKLNDPDWAYLRTAPGSVGVTNGVLR